MGSVLFYVHDPMCSWCWGFNKVWQEVQDSLPSNISVELILGGLAPDSNEPMPQTMQLSLQQTWLQIEQVIPGTRFNHEFWTLNAPRRSTYPACRAVLAAKAQNTEGTKYELTMANAIQQAYYLDAKNPSDDATLINLAVQIGLNPDQFSEALNSEQTKQLLTEHMHFARMLGAQGFPSLFVETESGQRLPIAIDYNNARVTLDNLSRCLAS